VRFGTYAAIAVTHHEPARTTPEKDELNSPVQALERLHRGIT
jgi:hypothetical protein